MNDDLVMQYITRNMNNMNVHLQTSSSKTSNSKGSETTSRPPALQYIYAGEVSSLFEQQKYFIPEGFEPVLIPRGLQPAPNLLQNGKSIRQKLIENQQLKNQNVVNNNTNNNNNNNNNNFAIKKTLDTSKLSSNNAAEWIKNALKDEKVNSISFNELRNPELLNQGGFGCIMKAVWTKTNNYVVYKRLTNTTVIKHDVLDAFIRELQIHLHLDYSDRIIRCLGISQDDVTKEYILVMQYADGGDLRNYLKNNFKKLTWNDKKRLSFQIAEGLNYLHNENVLHRDLHSRNIVVHENNAKITDFGISKFQDDQNSTAYIGNFGSIAYMEPNRILDPKFPYTKSSDIYSFGVLMWEISSGHSPFKNSVSNSEKFALAIAINNGTREATVPGTPKEYEKLYKNCWDKEPEQRPTVSEILDEFAIMGFGINAKNQSIKESINNSQATDDLYISS